MFRRTDGIPLLILLGWGGINFFTYAEENPVNRIELKGLESKGVESSVHYYKDSIWHTYVKVRFWTWTMGWVDNPYEESPKEKRRKHCNQMQKRNCGSLPDKTECKCATKEKPQNCVKNESHFPKDVYGILRNCGTWVKGLSKRCCIKDQLSHPGKVGFTIPIIGGWEQ